MHIVYPALKAEAPHSPPKFSLEVDLIGINKFFILIS